MKAHNPRYVERPQKKSDEPILRDQSVQLCISKIHVAAVFLSPERSYIRFISLGFHHQEYNVFSPISMMIKTLRVLQLVII